MGYLCMKNNDALVLGQKINLYKPKVSQKVSFWLLHLRELWALITWAIWAMKCYQIAAKLYISFMKDTRVIRGVCKVDFLAFSIISSHGWSGLEEHEVPNH